MQQALSEAIRSNNMGKISYLLQNGADVNGRDDKKLSPLFVAVLVGNPLLTKMLLNAGAIRKVACRTGRTLLMHAVRQGHPQIAKVLLNYGENVLLKDGCGQTAVSHAAFRGYTDCVEVLLKAGADINEPDRLGRTPLMHAIRNGHTETARYLIDQMADKTMRDKDGRTALDYAKECQCVDMIGLLTEPQIIHSHYGISNLQTRVKQRA